MYSTLTSDGPEMNREITGYLLSCKTTCTCTCTKKVHVQVYTMYVHVVNIA